MHLVQPVLSIAMCEADQECTRGPSTCASYFISPLLHYLLVSDFHAYVPLNTYRHPENPFHLAIQKTADSSSSFLSDNLFSLLVWFYVFPTSLRVENWVQTCVLFFTGCVALDKYLNFPEFQYSYLRSGDNLCSLVWVWITSFTIKHRFSCLVLSRRSVNKNSLLTLTTLPDPLPFCLFLCCHWRGPFVLFSSYYIQFKLFEDQEWNVAEFIFVPFFQNIAWVQ